MVVVDQVGLAVDGLDAAEFEADDLAGTSPGVAQQPVDHLLHGPQIGGGDSAGAAGRSEQVELGVELGDDRFG